MIPDFTADGLLPAGVHRASLEEFQARFAYFAKSDRRFRVFDRLRTLVEEAAKADVVVRMFVAGSFVTDKAEPNDFDCILVLDSSIVGRTLRPFEYNLVSRKAARRIYGGDVVPALDGSKALTEYLEFFQTTRDGKRMGIVEIV